MVDKRKIKNATLNILRAIGEDPEREGLKETPERIAQMYNELIKEDEKPPKLKSFKNENYDEIIAKEGIKFFSLCEHHMIPFYGEAHVAYIPDKKFVGLSKISRTVKYFSRRLQIQERFTRQIGDYLSEKLNPRGVIVVIEGEHLCEQMRGAEAEGVMKTSAVYGIFEDDNEAKKEALKLLGVE